MGRPKDEVRHKFQMILEQSKAHERFRTILVQTEKDEVFLKAYELANDRAFGRAEQSIEVNDISEQRPTREQLESAIARLTAIADGAKLDKAE